MPRQLVRGPSQPLCLPSHIRTILAAGPQAVVSSHIPLTLYFNLGAIYAFAGEGKGGGHKRF